MPSQIFETGVDQRGTTGRQRPARRRENPRNRAAQGAYVTAAGVAPGRVRRAVKHGVRAGSTGAGAEAGAVPGAFGGPIGIAVGGLAGGLVGSLAPDGFSKRWN